MSKRIGEVTEQKVIQMGKTSVGVIIPMWMRKVCEIDQGDEVCIALYENKHGFHYSVWKKGE